MSVTITSTTVGTRMMYRLEMYYTYEQYMDILSMTV